MSEQRVEEGWRPVMQELVDAMRRYEVDVEADAPQKHRDMMDRADRLLAASPAPAPNAELIERLRRDFTEQLGRAEALTCSNVDLVYEQEKLLAEIERLEAKVKELEKNQESRFIDRSGESMHETLVRSRYV